MNTEEKKKYVKGGGVQSQSGIEYQVKLTMLLFLRALKKNYKFQIASEREQAGKFDDLEIVNLDTKKHTLFQLKHEDEEKNKSLIDRSGLETMADSRFSIPKYFKSYLQTNKKSELNNMSYEYVIFTNIGLHENLINYFENATEDKLLDMKEYKANSKLLKLKRKSELGISLIDILRTTTDLEHLKFKFNECLKKKEKIINFKDPIFRKFKHTLLDKVIDEKNKKFKREFLNADPGLELRDLKNFLLAKFKDTIATMSITAVELDENEKNDSSIKANDDKVINEFLEKLVLAVNQPDKNGLDQIIQDTIGENMNFKLDEIKTVAYEIGAEITKWTGERQGFHLDQNYGNKKLKTIRQRISKLMMNGLTRDYCKKLKEYEMSFLYPSELSNFFEHSGGKILHLRNSQESVFSSIKVQQILEKENAEQNYVFSAIASLQRMDEQVLEAFESSNLLIIEYSSSNDKMTEKFATDLLNILNRVQNKKLVLISNEKSVLPSSFSDKVTIDDDRNSFSDLSKTSQDSILSKKQVSFQGYLFPIDRVLIPLIDADILFTILNSQLKIGTKLPDMGDVAKYYIPRKFKKIELGDSILTAPEFHLTKEHSTPKLILIAKTNDCVFESLSNRTVDSTFHLIHKEENSYVWKKTHGSNLSNLRKYIVPTERFYEEKTNMSEIKVVLIAAQAGMGKSTVLTSIANEFKKSNPSFWVLRVNLVDCSKILSEQTKSFDQKEAKEFLYKLISSTEKNNIRLLETTYFENCLKQGKVILYFDGFDEISPNFTEKVIELLQALRNTEIKQLWITTRPSDRICKKLEEQLFTLPHTLIPLEHDDKITMLKNLFVNNSIQQQDTAEQNAKQLMQRLPVIPFDLEGPLQVKLIATIFLNAFNSKDELLLNKLLEETNKPIDLVELYQHYFKAFFDDHIVEKFPELYAHRNNPNINEIIEAKRKSFEESSMKMALYTLFGKENFNKLLPKTINSLLTEIRGIDVGKHRLGIIERVVDNKPMFTHRTFAEYFVAVLLTTENIWRNPYFRNFMKERLFTYRENIISRFILSLIAKNDRYKANFQIHLAVLNNDELNLESLLKDTNIIIDVNAKDPLLGWSPLQYATRYEFWGKANLLLLTGADRKDLFDVLDDNFRHIDLLHIAARKNLLKIVQVIVELNTIDLYIPNSEGCTSLYLAIENDSLDVMKYLIDKCEVCHCDYDINEVNEVNNEEEIAFLVAINKEALRIVKYLLQKDKVDIIKLCKNPKLSKVMQTAIKNARKLVKCINETGKFYIDNKDQNNINLLQKSTENCESISQISSNTLIESAQIAVKKDYEYLVRLSGIHSNEQDDNGRTLLHFAIVNGELENLRTCDRPKLGWLGLDIIKHLIEIVEVDANKQDKNKQTALHLAIRNNLIEIVEFLLTLPQIALNIKDDKGQTALHLAAIAGQLTIVKRLKLHPKINVDIRDNEGLTALHIAVRTGHLNIVKCLMGTME